MNKIELNSQEEVWNKIAKSFDNTRKKPWNIVIDFINQFSSSAVIADLGCGNGRHLIPSSNIGRYAIGLDISDELLKIIKQKINKKQKNIILIKGNCVNLPFADESVDVVIYIAALHNIIGRKNRIQSLIEINRILKPNGKALISVWTRWQKKFRKHFVKELFKFERNDEFGDIKINWHQDKLNIPRFYHLYGKREFINDLKKSNLIIEKISKEKLSRNKTVDNFFAYVEKS